MLFLLPAAFSFPCCPGEILSSTGPLTPQFTFENWTIERGLPQNSILCLLQDTSGYLWLGTRAGLVRFDGVSFRVFNRWNTPNFKADTVTVLYQDRDGALWAGTEGGGLMRFYKERWTSFSTKNGLSDDDIRAVVEDRDGRLWIGTATGLNRMEKGVFTAFYAAGDPADFWGNAIAALAPSADGGLWIGTGSNGLYTMNRNRYRSHGTGDLLPGEDITALTVDTKGRLWIGTENGLACMENGKQGISIPGGHPLAENAVRCLITDSKGRVWIGTDGDGFYRFSGGEFTALPLPGDIIDDYIYSLLEDREGNIWIGTYGSGLVRCTPARVLSVTTEQGLPQNRVNALWEDNRGNLWLGTGRKGVVKWNAGAVSARLSPTGESRGGLPAGKRIISLYPDNRGNLWLGTQNSGLLRTAGGSNGIYKRYTVKEGLLSNEITAISGEAPGILRIGTSAGMNLLKEGRITPCPPQDGGESPYVWTLRKSRVFDGWWIGTRRGLWRLKGERLYPFSTTGGLPVTADIRALHEDADGALWIGTDGNGLARLKEGAISFYTTECGLPDNHISAILEDRRGALWLGSYRGVLRVEKKELLEWAEKGVPLRTPLVFDERDGMRSRECINRGHPTAWKTSDGKLWFPTVKGIAVFDPASIRRNSVPPGVCIEEVFSQNQPVAGMLGDEKVGPVRLPTGSSILEFNFTALSFAAPGKVKVRYMLEGFDSGWREVEPFRKRAAMYLNLPPGDYTFKVTGCNNDGVWNHQGAAFSFVIKTPFWRSPGVYILLALVLAAVTAALWRWRVRVRRRLLKKKRVPGPVPAGGPAPAVSKPEPREPQKKYQTSALLPETVDTVLPRLKLLMEDEQVFLNADLSLKALAKKLNIHYNHLSQIINEHFGLNFNDFINSYRIEAAKVRLTDPRGSKKTILEIAYETGFYSKSVFNTAFKKFSGQTPSQYRKENVGSK